jgi:hypothetical protein
MKISRPFLLSFIIINVSECFFECN